MKMFKTFMAVIAASLLSFSAFAANLTPQQEANILQAFEEEISQVQEVQKDPAYLALKAEVTEIEKRIGVDISQEQLIAVLTPYMDDIMLVEDMKSTIMLIAMMVQMADASDYNRIMTILEGDELVEIAEEIMEIEMRIYPQIIAQLKAL